MAKPGWWNDPDFLGKAAKGQDADSGWMMSGEAEAWEDDLLKRLEKGEVDPDDLDSWS
jgi:hypothetical protein